MPDPDPEREITRYGECCDPPRDHAGPGWGERTIPDGYLKAESC